jgi:hypothetical protein
MLPIFEFTLLVCWLTPIVWVQVLFIKRVLLKNESPLLVGPHKRTNEGFKTNATSRLPNRKHSIQSSNAAIELAGHHSVYLN